MTMTSRALIRWSSLHERRARTGGWLGSPLAFPLIAGSALAAWVSWRHAGGGLVAASHAWLAGALAAFALAFMRVPFHLYWRADAALLAQLSIEGTPLVDAALWRCVRAASLTTIAVVLGAAPLAGDSALAFARHAAVAGGLGLAAALFMPAVAILAAAFVAVSQTDRMRALRVATGIDASPRAAGAPTPATTTTTAPVPSTAALGALPGFASTLVIVAILSIASWLTGGESTAPATVVLGAIAATSVLAFVATRATAPRMMGTILRDVSALDRQRLATLEIRPPTPIERAIAAVIGDAALPYSKDARLMRRRYPMAFALGALIFLVLTAIGVARPDDPTSWLTAAFVGATAYGLAIAGRLRRQPIELVRLSSSLPITAAARNRAKLAWVIGWWTIFVALPGVFAALRQPDPAAGLALLGGGTGLVVLTALARRS